jgi:hypothetical protein
MQCVTLPVYIKYKGGVEVMRRKPKGSWLAHRKDTACVSKFAGATPELWCTYLLSRC